MSARVTPAESPPLWLVAPFFLAAPAGLAAAGVIIAGANSDSFAGVNLPRNLAIVHALVVGWVTTTMMGATYQLIPAVLGGRLFSAWLVRLQFALHVCAVPVFVWAFYHWDLPLLEIGGMMVCGSLVLYLANAVLGLARGSRPGVTRWYVMAALSFLLATGGFGLLWVMAMRHALFPITFDRIAAHAHLGLLGWLGLTVMGVSYQLVPMFNVVRGTEPRFSRVALVVTVAALIAFAGVMLLAPPRPVRVVFAIGLAAGPILWGLDLLRLMHHRSRRNLDVQGRATYLSLTMLAVTIALGFTVLAMQVVSPERNNTHVVVAYAMAGVLGWMGTMLIGNTYKILPFLLWYHRYRPLVGRAPVPVTADIYNDRAATAVLASHAAGVAVLVLAALLENTWLLRASGGIFAAVAVAHLGTMLHMFLPKTSSRPMAPATRPLVAR
ncbi:MAG: hypothetical protein HY875_02830 [Chloroflexi bacterium]|nr:hypothetical protein [Chloroflexota bacterium]